MEPHEVATYKRQLVRALVRRGQAHSGAGALASAAADYEEALGIDKDNEQLVTDLEEIRSAMQPVTPAVLRQRGESRFKSKDYEGAAQAYTAIIAIQAGSAGASDRLAALSNRAACAIVLERYADAVRDCDSALTLAMDSSMSSSGSKTNAANAGPACNTGEVDQVAMTLPPRIAAWTRGSSSNCSTGDGAASVLPAVPSSSQLASVSRLLARRGAACTYMKKYDEAVVDYQAAASLAQLVGDAGKAEALRADVARVEALRDSSKDEA
eukprot:gene2203-33761_t